MNKKTIREISIKHAAKTYGGVRALDNVSLTLKPNKIYGLLGRNGAGKSTLIKAIDARIFLNSGSILVDGEENVENEQALGKIYSMSESTSLPSYKVKSIFHWSRVYNPSFDSEYAYALASLFKLDVNKKPSGLSTGYKSILKFILTISSNLPYLFFDEPVLGLDATHREYVYKVMLERQMKTECTIVISTHIIEEVANMIESVAIIHKGTLLEHCDKDELLQRYYTVVGSKEEVARHAQGRHVVSETALGALSNCCIKGTMPHGDTDKLTFAHPDLQQLFISLTQTNEEAYYETIRNL